MKIYIEFILTMIVGVLMAVTVGTVSFIIGAACSCAKKTFKIGYTIFD